MSANKEILVVDDDPDICEIVEATLSSSGYIVHIAPTGESARTLNKKHQPALAIVDLGLPDIDGLVLVQELKVTPGMGIVILSGRSDTTERIIGLEVGADDYITKPFEPRELLARVRSVMRRLEPPAALDPSGKTQNLKDIYTFEGWSLDTGSLQITAPDGTQPRLSTSEFTLLQTFVEHPNRVLSRDQLLDMTHVNDTPAFDRSVDVQVTRLRKKIEFDPKNPQIIKTIRNRGYMFTARVDSGQYS